jgi:polysaccharide transporter, PST family
MTLIRLIKHTYSMAEPHEGRAVMNNVAFLSGLQAIMYLLPIIVLPFLFRTIGPERFGLIAFAQALVQYFIILTDYGFSVSATKEISLRQHENDHGKINEVFAAVMTIKMLLVVISFLILAAIVYFVPRFRYEWMVYILSFGMVAGTALFPVWFFQGMEKMKYIAKINILGEVIYALSIFSFVRGPQDYIVVPIINSFVFLTIGIVGQYIAFKRFGVSYKFPGWEKIRQEMKSGWDVFISIVAINAYTNSRVFAVGLFTNNTLTGFYSIAERIANVAQTFPLLSFSQAIFPRLSKIFHKNHSLAQKIMQQVQLITVLISLIFLPLIVIFAPWLVRVICGGYYPETIWSLRLLLVGVFFVSANAFRVQFLLVCGKTQEYSKIHVTMALVGLPLIILLIYYFSYVGAALATAFIEAGIFTLTYLRIRKIHFP